jgi:glucose/mannose-6-phosphate isomerase
MRSLIEQFPEFLADAIEIGKKADLVNSTTTIDNVVITGLGGSGIGGTIIAQLVASEMHVPIVVHKNYGIPNFVGPTTLLIGCSYSGNTEETLDAIHSAREKGAQIACITSGGQLSQLALENGWNCIRVPGGNPPRSMFAYSLTQLFFLFIHYRLIGTEHLLGLQAAQDLLRKDRGQIQALAVSLAQQLNGKRIVVYSDNAFSGVTERFRQQLNENSKQLAWHQALPEMNHNELVGWGGGDSTIGVVLFRSSFDNPRTMIRMDLSKKVFSRHTQTIVELYAKGESQTEHAFYLVLLGDWISLILAELNGVDPIEIEVIDFLKSELGRV